MQHWVSWQPTKCNRCSLVHLNLPVVVEEGSMLGAQSRRAGTPEIQRRKARSLRRRRGRIRNPAHKTGLVYLAKSCCYLIIRRLLGWSVLGRSSFSLKKTFWRRAADAALESSFGVSVGKEEVGCWRLMPKKGPRNSGQNDYSLLRWPWLTVKALQENRAVAA